LDRKHDASRAGWPLFFTHPQMALSIMIIACIFLTIFYVLLIGAYYLAWIRIPYFKVKPSQVQTMYSVLVPARNEALSIEHCLTDLATQSYPAQSLEIIVINDNSTDNTEQIVTDFISKHPTSNISLLNTKDYSSQGKKAAITYAIEKAKGSFIVLTDADCTRGKNWLSSIHSFMENSGSKMVYAPVMFKAKTIFEKLQSLEFAGLVAIGGAAIELKNPNMCSASNLIIEKEVFNEVEGYKGSEHIATGDDEYLLHKVCKIYPDDVHFLKNREAIVTTNANQTLGELASQRKRWVSASTKYENIYITAILIAAYLFNAAIVYQLFASPIVGLIMLAVKAFIEGLFLFNVLSFFGRKQYILLLPLAEPFHILYVLFIGLWANMGSYEWKGRNVR
jgi:cellulose synthase/poly-beta-1,6-N-acetylglucosamine synthase-like glycosyltransferase